MAMVQAATVVGSAALVMAVGRAEEATVAEATVVDLAAAAMAAGTAVAETAVREVEFVEWPRRWQRWW